MGKLRAIGFATMAPTQSPVYDVSVRHGVGMAARWSERHAAFVAGLGTFGISGGFDHVAWNRPPPGPHCDGSRDFTHPAAVW